jgi:hypothetical protein
MDRNRSARQARALPPAIQPRPRELQGKPFAGPFAIRRRTLLRLSKHKIEYLSDKILKALQEHPNVHLDPNNDLVVRAIDDAIYHNLQMEDEIDAEVEAHIEENVNEIRAMEMDVGALRNKIKRELARKKNFIL